MKASKISTSAQALFCRDWSSAKVLLGILNDASTNVVLRIFLSVVISAGDRLQQLICGANT